MDEQSGVRRMSDEEIHELLADYKEHKETRALEREQLLQCMNENKEAVKELTKLTNTSIESTKGLVEAWDASMGVVKVSATVGSFVKWGVGVGGPIYGLYLFIKHSGKVG